MYACGPTVYTPRHIGNFRTFVCLDVLRRTLKYLVRLPDAARSSTTPTSTTRRSPARSKAGMPLREYTEQWISAFREDTEQLGIETPEETPRATDEANMRAMGDMILALERNGHTYRRDGSIYFKISTLPDYGKLARLDHDGMQAGARVDVDEYSKDDARDFVLWKATKPGEPSWDVGAGPGRPGLAHRVLGDGAAPARRGADRHPCRRHRSDLPASRERDRAGRRRDRTGRSRASGSTSSICSSRTRRCRSRSATSTRVPDIVAKGYRPSALRYLLLSSHYRKQLNFTWAGMEQAEESLRRIVDFLARLDDVTRHGEHAGGCDEPRSSKARDARSATRSRAI